MPYTLNGVGTWYWGKREVQTRMDVCESCNRYGELKSYDTTLYFVILFLPVIPLGRKRIVDECPSCQRHRVMSLRQYHEARTAALREGIRAMQAAPQDASVAANTIRTLVAYHDWANFDKLAPALARTLSGNKDIQALLAEGYMFFSRHAQAEALWRQALKIEDNEEFRQRLAVSLVRQARPSEAEPFLVHILTGKIKEGIGLLVFLVEGYQAAGQHTEALAMLDRLAETWPELAGDKELRRHRRISEKNAGKGKPFRSTLMASPRRLSAGSGPDVTGVFAKAFLPIIAVVLLGGYLFWCWQAGQSREVHVVNGSQKMYAVSINGKSVRVKGGGRTPVNLPEGTWRIEPGEGASGVDAASVSFSSPFFSRPFDSTIIVLNPDRSAILVRQVSIYSKNPNPSLRETPPTVYCGELLYRIPSVDYVFREFPQTVTMSESSSYINKRRLYLEPPPDPTVYSLVGLQTALGKERMVEYLARRAAQEPATPLWMLAFSGHASPERLLEMIRPRLSDRPILVEWHRVYEDTMEKEHPEYDIVSEYRGLVEKEPNEPMLKYLLGRVEKSRTEATRLFEESEKGAQPIGYGYHAIAYERLCQGDFAGAAEYVDKALAVCPDSLQFNASQSIALDGAGQHERLLTAIQAERKASGGNVNTVIQEYACMRQLGRDSDAATLLNGHIAKYAKELEPKDVTALRNICQALAASRMGKMDEYARLCAVIGGPAWIFSGALASGDVEGASGSIAKLEKPEYSDHLMVYILARQKGKAALAETEWNLAMDCIRGAKEFDPDVAKAMLASPLKDPAVLVDAQILPRPKSILLTAFGLANPEQRRILFEKASRLNTQSDIIRPLLAKVLAGADERAKPD